MYKYDNILIATRLTRFVEMQRNGRFEQKLDPPTTVTYNCAKKRIVVTITRT